MEVQRPCDVDGSVYRSDQGQVGPSASGRGMARLGRAGRGQGRQSILYHSLNYNDGKDMEMRACCGNCCLALAPSFVIVIANLFNYRSL